MKNSFFLVWTLLLFSFQIIAQEPQVKVISFTLVNADTDEDLFELTDGMQIDYHKLPSLNLDIRAKTTADTESVQLSISSTGNLEEMKNTRTESLLPYAFFQDLPIGDYVGATFFNAFFTISAIPYTQDNLGGAAGTPVELTFEIVDYCQEATERSDVFITSADCNGEGGFAVLHTTLEISDEDAPYWERDANGDYIRNQDSGTYEVTVGLEPGCTITLKYTIGIDLSNCPSSGFQFRINTGGPEIEYNDKVFSSDDHFDSGTILVRPQTGLQEPYQSFRFGPSEQMSYDIPVADGEYTVNLYFAELWFGATGGGLPGAGRRVFDVNIEGQLAEDNLDVFAEVGAEAMLLKSHSVIVSDGELNIDFSSLESDGGERHPIINAIEIIGVNSINDRPFITTRSTYEKQIAVYADGATYNYKVDWGDGTSDTEVTSGIVHTYEEDGNYQISISGVYPRVNIFWDVDRHIGQLISVDQWGTIKWTSMAYAFALNHAFEIRADDVPDLSQVKSMAGMFDGGGLTINDKIKEWDVSTVTNMRRMFGYSVLNHDIGKWDVSNVTDMDGMFANTALSTENYDAILMGWSNLPSLENGVAFDAGDSKYCLGQAARQKLINDYGWTITDEGFSCFYDQLSVTEFVLVNADTEEDLFIISDGMKIDMRYLPTLNLDIRAETGTQTESVGFDLFGVQNIVRGESIPPYALFQDLPIGDYIGHEFVNGRYFLSATPYSENGLKGEAGEPLNISFEFIDSTLTVDGFTLIDAATDMPLFDLTDDLYLTVDDIPSLLLDIRANTSDDVESVRLELTGDQNTARTENLEPYALFRDLPIGDYIGNNFSLGSYTITATPFSGDNLTGEIGTPVSIDFRILESNPVLEITGFTLIDVEIDEPLFDLTDGMTITSDDLPSLLLSIRANTTENVNSVRIELSGSVKTAYYDYSEPYALSEYNGDYFGINFISGGNYTVKAIPFLGNDQDSKMGIPLSISFEIVDTVSNGKQSKHMFIAPNPVVSETFLSFDEPVQLKEILLFDVLGRLVQSYKGVEVLFENSYKIGLNDLKSGIYFIKSIDIYGNKYQEQVMVKKY